ncbi:MAG TPA: F0F1 ATP synthase subunit A [Candidatus Saccharimonadia bacterium]|nr:F0F1 ATP synthase subunit A [Candidatus Saccharimonadia bacterium]
MNLWLAEGPHVSLPAEHLFDIGPIHILNSMALGVLGTAVVLALFFYTRKKVEQRKHTRLSVAVLWLFEILLGTVEEVLGDRKMAVRLAPLAITMFVVIWINNWFGLLPFVGPLTYHGEPFFRGLATDLNFTAALAVITMVTAQIWAIRAHGFFGNLGRYFANPFTNPMGVFEGFLEIIAEFSRLISLAMRLFGNIFGGEVLLAVMGFISAYAAPVALPPFLFLELFVGAIQAYVFFMLTVVFVSLGIARHHEPATSDDASTIKEAAPA